MNILVFLSDKMIGLFISCIWSLVDPARLKRCMGYRVCSTALHSVVGTFHIHIQRP